MPQRHKLSVPGVPDHLNPIPQGVRMGNMVFSSAMSGADPETGEMPADPETQAWNTFRNIRLMMQEAGGSVDDIARMTVYMRDLEHRKYVNDAWLDMFPDPDNRPARHTLQHEINERFHLQIEFIAVMDRGV